MIEIVQIEDASSLEDYSAWVALTPALDDLKRQAAQLLPRLRGRKVWMVNSTATGGGVAEMLPTMITLLRDLGLDIDWVVMGTEEMAFFDLTKRIHNLIHGHGKPSFRAEDRALYEAVSRENAEAMKQLVGPNDILVIHDPQPLGMGAMLLEDLDIPSIFRCHIGLDEDLPQTRAAWDFLRPYTEPFDYAVFSAPEYIPDFLAGRAGIIYPAIDPIGDKNRELTTHKLVGILCNAQLDVAHHPVLMPTFPENARRLDPDGSFSVANWSGGVGLLYRPIVTQISRWDRLKGWKPLLEGFCRMKLMPAAEKAKLSDLHLRRLDLVRLVLAGPDPAAVADDPEGMEVLQELIDAYCALPPRVQEDVALLSLPMGSRKNNAVMVNALQRCSTVVVQNSLREGFGLTATEGMWKRTAVLSTHACGIRQQIRDGIEGHLIRDPEDPQEIAVQLNALLEDHQRRAEYAKNAQRRVFQEFLVFRQVQRWLEVLADRADPS